MLGTCRNNLKGTEVVIWKTLSKETIFDQPPYLRVTKEKLDTGHGKIVDDFFQVELRTFAIVVPILQDGRICVIRQYKHGPRRVSLTFPAGFLEDDEAAEAAAKRELLEETGLHAQNWKSLGDYIDNGNQRGCHGHYFLATGCTQMAKPNSGDLEEMEILHLDRLALDQAARSGEFSIVHNIAAWGLARLSGLNEFD